MVDGPFITVVKALLLTNLLMLFFALATPEHAAVPVRVRRLQTHR